MDDSIGLGGRGHVPLAGPGQFKGIADDPVHAAPCKDALLDRHLRIGTNVKPPSDFRVLTLVVFPDHPEVNVFRPPVPKGGDHALEHADRSDIDVLLQVSSYGDQKPPERDVVRYAGVAHGAQEDGLALAQLLDRVLRHHAAGLVVELAVPGVLGPIKGDLKASPRGIEDPHPLRRHFLSDPVSRYDGNAISLHELPPCC